MSSNAYELTYFAVKGLANMIRLILEDHGIKYKFTVVTPENWSDIRPHTPFGQVPVLTVNGETKLSQSLSIVRFLAREHGLAGASNLEQAQVEMWIDQATDVRMKFVKIIYSNFEESLKPFLESLPAEFAVFEKQLAGQESKDHLLFGKLTAADYVLFDLLLVLVALNAEWIESVPSVKAFYESFGAREKVAAFLNRDDIKEMKFTGSVHL